MVSHLSHSFCLVQKHAHLNWPNSLAQFLVLFPFANDSFHFSSEIFELDSNLFVRSLHVDSLFTKIPLTKTIETFVNSLFQYIDILKLLMKLNLGNYYSSMKLCICKLIWQQCDHGLDLLWPVLLQGFRKNNH